MVETYCTHDGFYLYTVHIFLRHIIEESDAMLFKIIIDRPSIEFIGFETRPVGPSQIFSLVLHPLSH